MKCMDSFLSENQKMDCQVPFVREEIMMPSLSGGHDKHGHPLSQRSVKGKGELILVSDTSPVKVSLKSGSKESVKHSLVNKKKGALEVLAQQFKKLGDHFGHQSTTLKETMISDDPGTANMSKHPARNLILPSGLSMTSSFENTNMAYDEGSTSGNLHSQITQQGSYPKN